MGWISIYRRLQNHWLWDDKPFAQGQAWIDLIMRANHKGQWYKHPCMVAPIWQERGAFITSLRGLALEWGWSISRIKRFLNALKSEQMLEHKSEHFYTVISILNYDSYQGIENNNETTEETPNGTTTKHNRNTSETQAKTINKDNKDNNYITTICVAKATTQTKKSLEPIGKSENDYNPNDLLWYFGKCYKDKIGFPYTANFGKDGKIFKDLLAVPHPPKMILEMIDLFFHDDSGEWHRDKLDVGIFRTQVNKLAIKIREIKNQQRKE